jgi:hypothetical protein
LRAALGLSALGAASLASRAALAGDALQIVSSELDPPTVITLGVQMVVSGDDNRNAHVDVRYRKMGDAAWKNGFPLHRVRPAVVTGLTVEDQFAGSVLDLAPATTYEIELHAVDPDGVDETVVVSGATRRVPPLEPASPKTVAVTSAAELQSALDAASPGDVIELGAGTYAGNFGISASGTEDNPIVIRGAGADSVVLDGQGCDGCNVLEVYGSFVHVERLAIANASRGLRFQGTGAEGNVVRRVRLSNVILGIGSKADQRNFYICDNELEGRLVWPQVYSDDGGNHSNDDGIHMEGTGHVVCHNRLYGFGDAIKIATDGAVSIDFYGNEVLSAYDNGVELDGSARNVRCFENRFTNTYATISFQPIFGGPAYALRNVVVNVTNEQLKFHALGTTPPQEPSGMYVIHNTFVSPRLALDLQTSATSHDFVMKNNLFVGPAVTQNGRTVDWTGPIDNGIFDWNGYFPDGEFAMNFAGTGYIKAPSFAELQAAGVEPNGRLLAGPMFEKGIQPPADYTVNMPPADVTLAEGSSAVDAAEPLPGLNDRFEGSAPDLGALERGCPAPTYGVRSEGVDESTAPAKCGSGQGGSGGNGGAGGGNGGAGGGNGGDGGAGASTSSGSGGDGNGNDGSGGGCGCRTASSHEDDGGIVMLFGIALGVWGARRRRY